MNDLVSLRITLKSTVAYLELVIDSICWSNPIVVDMGELLQKCRRELYDLEADPDSYSTSMMEVDKE